MHHWADPTAGLAEIGRVLRPGGRALVWDFRPGVRPHPVRTTPHAHARSGPTDAWLSASDRQRDAMALALEVQPDPAGRARPRQWRSQALTSLDRLSCRDA